MVQHIIVVHGNEKFRIRPCRCGAGSQCISSSITRLTWSVRMRMCVARRALSAYTGSTIEGTRATAEVFLRYVILLLLCPLLGFPPSET